MTQELLDPIIEDTITTVATQDFSAFSLFLNSDYVSKIVVLILICCSIFSWTIVFQKFFLFLRLKSKVKAFENVFWSGQSLNQLHDRLKAKPDNPFAEVFLAAMNEWKKHELSQSKRKEPKDFGIRIGTKERLSQAMEVTKTKEIETLESGFGFLAIVGSNAPFIGLFGTVWGIMHSFESIASSNNTSLAVVAPGIAEALFATAIALVAAIPATIFYNVYASKVNSFAIRLDEFSSELYTLFSRALDDEA